MERFFFFFGGGGGKAKVLRLTHFQRADSKLGRWSKENVSNVSARMGSKLAYLCQLICEWPLRRFNIHVWFKLIQFISRGPFFTFKTWYFIWTASYLGSFKYQLLLFLPMLMLDPHPFPLTGGWHFGQPKMYLKHPPQKKNFEPKSFCTP